MSLKHEQGGERREGKQLRCSPTQKVHGLGVLVDAIASVR